MNATLTWTAGTIQAPLTGVTSLFTAWVNYRLPGMPEDPDEGTAGVREPRRPLPSAPAMSMSLA